MGFEPQCSMDFAKILGSGFTVRRVAARAYISLPGDATHELLFVCQGLLRFYYVSGDGKESNKAFIAENEFAGPLASAMLNLPIYYGIQALEPTTLLAARSRRRSWV